MQFILHFQNNILKERHLCEHPQLHTFIMKHLVSLFCKSNTLHVYIDKYYKFECIFMHKAIFSKCNFNF